jgi:hypothetical protein
MSRRMLSQILPTIALGYCAVVVKGFRSRVTSTLSPLLRSFIGLLAITASLLAVGVCAQISTTSPKAETEPTPEAISSDILRPYLGKWRPTSYSEGLNIGSLTISEDRLALEVGGASVSYEIDRQIANGVFVRVTGRTPANAFPGLTALAFSVAMETVTGPPPGRVTKTRELLRICYWSGSLDQLASKMSKTSCGNAYTR